MKLFESEKTLAFLDVGPLSKGHAVRIRTFPKQQWLWQYASAAIFLLELTGPFACIR